jgi:hypothetical protein
VVSTSRRRCTPRFDQTQPFLRPDRAGQSVARSRCQGRPQGRRTLARFALDRSEHDGSRPSAEAERTGSEDCHQVHHRSLRQCQ